MTCGRSRVKTQNIPKGRKKYQLLKRCNIHRGVARIFQRGVTIRGSPTIYGLYHCSPSCISGLSRIIAAWRPILTKDKSRWWKYFTKKVGFTAKILLWRFRHLDIVGCLLKRRPTKGEVTATPGHPPPPPLATPLYSCWYYYYYYYYYVAVWNFGMLTTLWVV